MKIAIIPARSKSKRIKNKNVMDFYGKPMISYALDVAHKSRIFDKIHVSTDSEDFKVIVETLGYTVDFVRPKHLADDFTGLMPVMQWVIQQYRERGEVYEDICCLMPTAPLLEKEDILKAYEQYISHQRKYPLHMVASFPVPVEWAFRKTEDGFLIPVFPGKFACRSQDLENVYYESGPFSFFHISHILAEQPVGDKNFVSCVLPRDRAVDIDTEQDIELAGTLYLGKLLKRFPDLINTLLSSRQKQGAEP